MSEEGSQQYVEGEANRDEQARRVLHKQKIFMKAALRETRTLTDADIKVIMNQARTPGSALLGSALTGGLGATVSDFDPRDPITTSDSDLSPADSIRITDMDPTDPWRRPWP